MTWHLIYTKPQKESLALEKLSEQGLMGYLPMYRQEKIIRQKRIIRKTALFPRYLFIFHDLHFFNRQHVIRSTPGVSWLLMLDGIPLNVTDKTVRLIQDIESKQIAHPANYFSRGEAVQIFSGVMAGFEGIYANDDGEHRAMVLVNLIQKEHCITLEKAALKRL